MILFDDGSTLAQLYHLNSQVWNNYERYTDPGNEPQFMEFGGESVPLQCEGSNGAILPLIKARHSCRHFAHGTIRKEAIASILCGAYGVCGIHQESPFWAKFERAVPSAGGLYPLEIYASLERVENISDGVYHYLPVHNCLEKFPNSPQPADVKRNFLQPEFVDGANLIVLISAKFSTVLYKYGPRGYRYTLLEGGHLAQNLCLVATENSLGSLCIGGFDDFKMNCSLGLDGKQMAVIYCVAIGSIEHRSDQLSSEARTKLLGG